MAEPWTMSSALPCGTPSTTSTRTMSPSSLSPARSAKVPPICPAPISAILLRAMPILSSAAPAGAQSRVDLRFQMLGEERNDVLPQLGRRALAIARPGIGEESMPGVPVDLDLDFLAGALRAAAQLFRLRDSRVLVLLAEDREERAVQPVDYVQDRGRA